MILSPQQHAVVARLAPITKIATDGSRVGLPLKVRTHSLIVGPSGCGKSHLAQYLGEQMGLPVLMISAASWIIIASRSEPWTWTKVLEWLVQTDCGILIIDEVEKCRSESSPYEKYVILELMELLDGNIPISVPIPSIVGPWDELPDEIKPRVDRSVLEQKLRDRVMILGCGAWQSLWTKAANMIGFASDEGKNGQPPSSQEILSGIDPEFRRRFRSEVAFLFPMTREDYQLVASQLLEKLPTIAQAQWNQLAPKAIDKALAESLGMRVFEELLLDSMILEKAAYNKELQHNENKHHLEF